MAVARTWRAARNPGGPHAVTDADIPDLNEVFGSLDETRRHNVVDLLRRLQDRFEQVILITHIESVREGLDRVVTVRYDEESGASSVENERPEGGKPQIEMGVA